MKQKIIDFLVDNADSSIVLRVKKEVINCLSKEDEDELLNKIILQKNVQTVIQSQKPDGWFGNSFHGQSASLGAGMYDNMEVGLRYLAEKGFPPGNDYIAKAINSFIIKEPFDAIYGGKPPKPPATDYTYTASGLYLARSSIIIRAGYEYQLAKNHFINLKHDIDFSFNTFSNVLNYFSLDDVIDTNKKKLCFKPGILWPCLYHLRMLAHSQGWRNEQSISLLADSVNRLFSFPQSDEMVYTYVKGQYVGPCFAFIHAQGKILDLDSEKNISLDLLELFARCGIVKNVAILKSKYEYLLSLIDDNLNVDLYVDKRESRNWSPYFGFALEEDWRKTKKNNVIFYLEFYLLYIMLNLLYSQRHPMLIVH